MLGQKEYNQSIMRITFLAKFFGLGLLPTMVLIHVDISG